MTAPTPIVVAAADPSTHRWVALTLGRTRYRVVGTDDTESAVREVVAERPGLVVVDTDLPGAGALALARTLRAEPETAPVRVVLLTDRDGADHRGEPGVDLALARTASSLSLLGAVEHLLAGR